MEATTGDNHLGTRLGALHRRVQEDFPGLNRIAVALYDAKTDRLKTFLESTRGASPLVQYEARLADVPSLRLIAETRQPRIIDRIDLDPESALHTRRLYEAGARASLTQPILGNRGLVGFLFYNADRPAFFRGRVVRELELYSELISVLVVSEISSIHTLSAAVRTAREFGRHRDEETGAHLERMARYCQVVARHLATKHGLSDEYIEMLYQLSPLHDLGKVAVPDHILLKPGRLDDDEFEVMKSHVAKGTELIDVILREFGLDTIHSAHMLRSIVAHHHEALDGSGYPQGITGEAIPLEARIAAVADVFDALTSSRPYKQAWTNDEAYALLVREAGVKFDPDCVQALVDGREAVEEIQARFAEDSWG